MAAGKNLGSQVQGSPLSLGGDFPEIKLIVQYWYEGIATTKYSFYPLLRINPCSLSSPSLPLSLSLSLASSLACLVRSLSLITYQPSKMAPLRRPRTRAAMTAMMNPLSTPGTLNLRSAFPSFHSTPTSSLPPSDDHNGSPLFPITTIGFRLRSLSLSLFLLFGKKKFLKNASVLYRPATSYDNFQ